MRRECPPMNNTVTTVPPPDGAPHRRRLQGIAPRSMHIVPVVAALCVATTGCSDFWDQPAKNGEQPLDPDYAAFCADPHTGFRVLDDECDPAPETFTGSDYDAVHYQPAGDGHQLVALWYYLDATSGRIAPPVGGRVAGGTYRTPQTRIYDPRKPAVIVRQGSTPTEGGKIDKSSVNRSVKSNSEVRRGGLGVSDRAGRTANGPSAAS